MDRMHEMGAMITKGVKEQIEALVASKKLEVGELLIGSPGYAVVLSLSGVENRAQNRAPINKGVGKRGPKPKAKPAPEV